MIDTLISGVSAGTGVLKALSSLIGKTKGPERAVLMELKGNIRLLKDYLDHGLPKEKVIEELSCRQMEKALHSNFDFRRLQRKKLSAKLTGESKWAARYTGWTTERIFENIYLKITNCQRLVRIGCDSTGINLHTRLKNILRMTILAARHL